MALRFLKTAFQDYLRVGGVVPSSKYTCQRVASKLSPRCLNIVEYGGGTGAVTRELLKKLPASGKLIVIEVQKEFIKALQEIDDPRMLVIHGDVGEYSAKLKELFPKGPDAVVCGIPLLFFKEAFRNTLLKNTCDGLSPEGRFIIYQHSLQIVKTLKKIFSLVKFDLEIRNFPPYFIFTAFK